MKLFRSRPAIAIASAAALAMTATPAMARGWHHRHDRGIDAGDVFAGLLIIGGIAAVASAAGKANRDKRERERDYRDPDQRYPDSRYPDESRDRDYREPAPRYGDDPRGDRPYAGGTYGGVSLDAAVDQCASEIERGSRRIDEIDSVSRYGEGWRVEGRVKGGSVFTCSVDADGRIRNVTVDGRGLI